MNRDIGLSIFWIALAAIRAFRGNNEVAALACIILATLFFLADEIKSEIRRGQDHDQA